MTLAIIIFLLATAVLLLVTLPFVMMIFEIKHDLWVNIKFWAIAAATVRRPSSACPTARQLKA